MPDLAASLDAHTLERAAAVILDDALALASALHLPGGRDRHRRQIEHAIDLANRVLAAAVGGDARTSAGARSTLVKANAARARDARHGAGQLSLGAQRAPTCEACDDGWQRVEGIVAVAESSALVAARMAAELDNDSAWKAARAAEAAARDARRIVDERNHAYTFHTDPGFSFGEGWYLAAAAVLAGVAIQIEPGKPQTPQAERFLQDAGLSAEMETLGGLALHSAPATHRHPTPLASPFGDFGTCSFPTTPARCARALALGLAR